MSPSEDPPVDGHVAALVLVAAAGGWAVSLAVPGAERVATAGQVAGTAVVLLFVAHVLRRSYRRNVLDVTRVDETAGGHRRTAQPGTGQDEGTRGRFRPGHEWLARYTSTDFKLRWTWVLLAVLSFVFPWGGCVRIPGLGVLPFLWYAFPAVAVVGFSLSHRVFVGPPTGT